MSNNFSDWEFIAIFWSKQLFFEPSDIWLKLNIKHLILVFQIFSNCGFARALSPSHNPVPPALLDLIDQRKVQVRMNPSLGLQEINIARVQCAVHVLSLRVKVYETTEFPVDVFKCTHFRGVPREVNQNDFLGVQVLVYYRVQPSHFVLNRKCQWNVFSFVDCLNVKNTEKLSFPIFRILPGIIFFNLIVGVDKN